MGQSAAASESHSETRFGGASTADVFAFEDLLDFSNDDDDEVELGEGEFEKGAPPRCCPLLDAPDSVVCSTYANNTAAAATCDADLGAAGLCPVPYEELNAELEWVSDHLDEDEPALSIEDAEKLRLISGSGTTNPTPLYASPSSSSSTLTSVPSSSTSSGDRCSSSSYSTCSNDNSLQQLRLINDDEYALLDADGGDDGIDAAAVLPQPLHSRGARSKRSRADPGSLASRLAVLLTSTATTADAADLGAFHANVSACSSSSSYNTTDAVPFDTHRKKPPKVIVNPPSKKITKPVVLQRQQPQSRCYGAEDEPVRRCLHCATDQTPQWRAGPMGPKTLCNACGVRYKSGRLVPEYRPAASPTFVMSKHSNSHRKVMELRRQKEHHQMIKLMQLHEPDGERHIRRSSSTAHMFPLAAGDGLYLEAPAAGADTAPPDDFLMHHRVGPDFRHLI